MTAITRHETDPSFALELISELSEDLQDSLQKAPRNPMCVYHAQSEAYSLACYRTIIDPSVARKESWDAFRLAARCSAALVEISCTTEGHAEIQLDRKVSVPALGTGYWLTPNVWLMSVWLNVATKNEAAIERLCRTPIDTLRGSGAQFDEYIFHWISALQLFLRHTEILDEPLQQAIEGTKEIRYTYRDSAVQLNYPAIELFYRVLQRDPKRFNESLVRALHLHRRFWTTGDNRREPEGFIALPLTAISIFARRAGMNIDVDSDYLPRTLLREPGPIDP